MVRIHPQWLLPLALLAAIPAVQAQSMPRAGKPDPLDPRASVPPLIHAPAFARYRRLGDDKPLPWKEANDTVTRIGGWRAYAREARPEAPLPAASAASSPPQGHGGHPAR